MTHFFDIGVNLTNNRFADDLEEVIARAKDASVAGLLLTGTSVLESQATVALNQRFPGVCWSTVGVHPHDAAQVTDDYIEQLRELAKQQGVVAIGECGLDFNRNFSPPEKQIEVFQQQLTLSQELQLPLFLHERDAFEQQVALLAEVPYLKGVAHCFTGSVSQMQTYLELGLYVGVTGWLCDAKRGATLREAVKVLPLERLLIETDAPFLTPKTLPGKVRRNEPCYLPHIAQAIAELKSVTVDEVAEASLHNAESLFAIKVTRFSN